MTKDGAGNVKRFSTSSSWTTKPNILSIYNHICCPLLKIDCSACGFSVKALFKMLIRWSWQARFSMTWHRWYIIIIDRLIKLCVIDHSSRNTYYTSLPCDVSPYLTKKGRFSGEVWLLRFIRVRSKRASSETGPSHLLSCCFPLSLHVKFDRLFFIRSINGEMTKQQLCLAHYEKFPVLVTIIPFYLSHI